MAYIILSVGAVLFLFWFLAFVFAIRTEGERSLFIPLFFSLIFGGLSGWGGMLFTNSPEDRLTSDKFLSLKPGMSPEDVKGILGEPDNLDELLKRPDYEDLLKVFDLTANSIRIASTVKTKLSPFQSPFCRLVNKDHIFLS